MNQIHFIAPVDVLMRETIEAIRGHGLRNRKSILFASLQVAMYVQGAA